MATKTKTAKPVQITDEIYKAFEAVVGPRNITRDPAMLESYRVITPQSSDHRGPYDAKSPTPQMVALPGDAAEVQSIVRLCNKYKIQFKASSSFWSVMGFIADDYSIQVDMRRMQNIEIDPKNMIAIVDAGVPCAAVQAEAMKYGLNINIPGIGCSSSLVASATSWVGFGPNSISMGHTGENMLGVEWVLPNGELVRTGSWGAGLAPFCGEGPGPSARGMVRGKMGAAGSIGIFTKIATRLHPWPGPKVIPQYGEAPAYKADLPDNFKAYTLCFPDWAAYAECINYLHRNEVIYLGHRQFTMFGRDIKVSMVKILTDPDLQFCDLPRLMEDPEIKAATEDMKIDCQIILAGMTKRDMEYKEAALDEILRLSGGHKSEFMLQKDIHDWVLQYLIRMGHKNLNYTLCGSYEGNFGMAANVDVTGPLMEDAAALKRRFEQEHPYIAAVGGDSEMGSLSMFGGGGTTGWEFFVHFDAYDKESIHGARRHIDESQKWMNEHGLGADMGRWNEDARRPDSYNYTREEHDAMYAKLPQPEPPYYQYRMWQAFNPNNLCTTYYRTLSTEAFEKAKGRAK